MRLYQTSLVLFFIITSLMIVPAFAESTVNMTISNPNPSLGETVTISCSSNGSPASYLELRLIENNAKESVLNSGITTLFDRTYTFFEVGFYDFSCTMYDTSGIYRSEINVTIIENTHNITPTPPINWATIDYNPLTHDVDIAWNFDLDTCYSKSDVLFYEALNGYSVRVDTKTFLGTDSRLLNANPSFEISCDGEFTFNIFDYSLSENFDGFELWVSFYDSPSTHEDSIINEVGMSYSESLDLDYYDCFGIEYSQNEMVTYTDYYYDVDNALKIVGTEGGQCEYIDQYFEELDGEHVFGNSHHPHGDSSSTSETKKNGGGCSGDCTPPTIGVDNGGVRMVNDGLILNGVSFDVNNFKNVMPMQYIEIGKENHLEVKIYENGGSYNIDKFQFGIVKEIGSPMNLAEPRIEIDIANFANDIDNAIIDGVILKDSDNILRDYNVQVSLVDCMVTSSQECLKIDIFWSFDKVPTHNVILVNGWDNSRNPFNNYFNHGITVIDPNHVEIIEEIPIKIIELSIIEQRLIHEEERAILIFDASKLIAELGDSWTYDTPNTLEKQIALQERMDSEADRAEKELQEFFDYIYMNKVHD